MFGHGDHRGPFGPKFGFHAFHGGGFGPKFGFHAFHGGGFGRPHHGQGRGDDEAGGGWPFDRRFGAFGPPFPGKRFGRGDLKYVILNLLKDRPRHGYDVIRGLEERFGGAYNPSPGSVYPTLQLLEDQGYLSSSEQDGKRVYAITDEGRRFLTERADAIEGVFERFGDGWGPRFGPELRELMQEVRQLGMFVFAQGSRGAFGDPERVRRLREVVQRARHEIEAIFTDEPKSPNVSV